MYGRFPGCLPILVHEQDLDRAIQNFTFEEAPQLIELMDEEELQDWFSKISKQNEMDWLDQTLG